VPSYSSVNRNRIDARVVGHNQRMYLVQFEAIPSPGGLYARENPEIGGAYVNAWIDYADEWGAVELARAYTRAEGLEEATPPQISTSERDACPDDAVQYYDAAMENGYSIVIYAWPRDTDAAEN
jgi:hypothetical protein